MTSAAGDVGPVLGLTQQVGRHQRDVGRLVGDHRHLRRTGQQVDADPPEQLPLRLRHKGVAGADDHVHRRLAQQSERHRGQRLHATEQEDAIGSRDGCRVQHGRIGVPVLLRRRTCQHGIDAGHLRDVDRHEGTGQQREPARRQVGAHPRHRDVPLPGDQAGHQLDLEIAQVRTLDRGELRGALGAQLESLLQIGLQPLPGCADGRLVEFDRPGDRVIELRSVVGDRIHPAGLDVPQHFRDRFGDRGVMLRGRSGDHRRLQEPIPIRGHGTAGAQLHTYNIGPGPHRDNPAGIGKCSVSHNGSVSAHRMVSAGSRAAVRRCRPGNPVGSSGPLRAPSRAARPAGRPPAPAEPRAGRPRPRRR